MLCNSTTGFVFCVYLTYSSPHFMIAARFFCEVFTVFRRNDNLRYFHFCPSLTNLLKGGLQPLAGCAMIPPTAGKRRKADAPPR